MKYRITEEEIFKQWEEYRADYPPFVEYVPSERELSRIAASMFNVMRTQNGQDFDDYCITDEKDNVGKYLADVPRGHMVLIHGVGTGREVKVAKEMGLIAVGTTLGSRNVEFAKRYLGLKASDIRECLFDALPFRDSSFDVVAAFQTFEHVVAPLPFLLEQSRVLKMGGKLLLEWPAASTHTMDDNPHHQICYTPGQAHGLFRKAGFTDIKMYYNDFQEIPESLWWSGEDVDGKYLCIEGIKVECDKDYVQRAWEGV